jgi:hypothetical protein
VRDGLQHLWVGAKKRDFKIAVDTVILVKGFFDRLSPF